MNERSFDLKKLLLDVFAPQPGERVVVMTDMPHDALVDHAEWAERRRMAEEWRQAFERLGVDAQPLLRYPATGVSNADLPESGEMAGRSVQMADVLAQANIVVAMTEYSATAPLSAFARQIGHLRVASMPGVSRRMEQTALTADYRLVAQRAQALAKRLTRAEAARVTFSTGHQVQFDLRYRKGEADDGLCHPGQVGGPVINLPSGEAFIVPYEGEHPGIPSHTAGTIPVRYDDELVLFQIERNRVERVEGHGHHAARMRAYFAVDPARRNIAELGLGCNDRAVVTGNVLEDEKAGMHWAYGRSEHLGGIVGPDAFKRPGNVVHEDIVYARNCPIGITRLVLCYPDGSEEEIMRDGEYTIF